MKVTLNKDTFITKFIGPISKVTERCVISIFPDRVQTLVTTKDSNPIVYACVKTPCDLGEIKSLTLNIPNINKLSRMLNCLNSETIELEINSNNIEYNSPNMRFKYHLLENGVIESSPITVEKLDGLAKTFDASFTMDNDKLVEIMRGTTFATDSNKVYFYTKDEKVYAELTDKEISNTDSVTYFITDQYDGEPMKKPMLIDLEIFKMFSGLKRDVVTKINTKNRCMMFKFEDTDFTLQYIVSPLVK